MIYAIRDRQTGEVYKIGESMRGVNKQGESVRAAAQRRQLAREQGKNFKTEIRETFPSKVEARSYETRLIQKIRGMNRSDALPGNKGVH